ncbi:MAG: hypothetical protein KY443_00820 [Actinobacteria bacterium]|nr:hypothetical protein [Actinomycetota bacterium]
MTRVRILVVLALVVVAGGVVDRYVQRQSRWGPSVATAGMPEAAPGSALSSTWYCAGGSGKPGSPFLGGITVANPTDHDVEGTVTVVPDQGDAKTVPLTVKPSAATTLAFADVVPAAYVGALVDVDSGQVVVEHWVAGPAGTAVAPCASRASRQWFFAGGATARDAQLVLSLYNPFPEDAIVDLSFATNEGRAAPAAFQGIVVPAGRVVARDLGEHVRRRDIIATHVQSRAGRLVADQLLVRTGPGEAGVSVRLGAPAPALAWYFPDGYYTHGITERYTLFNPSDLEALVDLEVTLDEGAAEPFELTVPPHGVVTVTPSSEERLPKGVGRSAVVRVYNNVGVVAERSVTAVPPAPRAGRADVLGATRTARLWAFAYGAAGPTRDQWVIVHNPGVLATRVSFTALADGQPLALEGLQDVAIGPGQRRAFRVGEHVQRDSLSLVVRSTGDVVVQRSVFVVGGPGIADSLGIPLD